MALVKHLKKTAMDRNSIHREVDATYTVFNEGGHVMLQIDTYGSKGRKFAGAKSQSIQLDDAGARNLFNILKSEFSLA